MNHNVHNVHTTIRNIMRGPSVIIILVYRAFLLLLCFFHTHFFHLLVFTFRVYICSELILSSISLGFGIFVFPIAVAASLVVLCLR